MGDVGFLRPMNTHIHRHRATGAHNARHHTHRADRAKIATLICHHRWWLALFRPIAAARCRRITCEHGSAPWLALLGFRLFLPRWLFLANTARASERRQRWPSGRAAAAATSRSHASSESAVRVAVASLVDHEKESCRRCCVCREIHPHIARSKIAEEGLDPSTSGL